MALPDIESAAKAHLDAATTAAVALKVPTTWTPESGSLVTVRRIGGSWDGFVFDDARLEVDCRAKSSQAAWDLAVAMREALAGLLGTRQGVVFYGWSEDTVLPLTDPDHKCPLWRVSGRVAGRVTPPAA